MKTFRQFREAKEKTAVVTFGRMNPPTIGHQKLVQCWDVNISQVSQHEAEVFQFSLCVAALCSISLVFIEK